MSRFAPSAACCEVIVPLTSRSRRGPCSSIENMSPAAIETLFTVQTCSVRKADARVIGSRGEPGDAEPLVMLDFGILVLQAEVSPKSFVPAGARRKSLTVAEVRFQNRVGLSAAKTGARKEKEKRGGDRDEAHGPPFENVEGFRALSEARMA